MNETIFIPGAVGALEAGLARADEDDRWAVLCHPHPQYGGSMHDAVLDTVAKACLAANISVLRFNFRGVGGSDGHYDSGVGEVDDALAALRWVSETEQPAYVLFGGYSFGSAVTWRACQTDISPDLALLVAPPVGMMDFAGEPPAYPVHAIAGTRDEFVDQGQFAAWTGATTHTVEGADHFFSGTWSALEGIVAEILS